MDQNILDAIQKSLPSMQMEILKKELEKAAKVEKLEKDLQESRNAHSKLILEYDALKKLEIDMKTKIEECVFIKREFEVKQLKYEIESQKQISKEIKELAMAAFRNPTISKSFNRNIPLKNNEYSSGSTMYESSFETETRD